jgi:hypothetical protein
MLTYYQDVWNNKRVCDNPSYNHNSYNHLDEDLMVTTAYFDIQQYYITATVYLLNITKLNNNLQRSVKCIGTVVFARNEVETTNWRVGESHDVSSSILMYDVKFRRFFVNQIPV